MINKVTQKKVVIIQRPTVYWFTPVLSHAEKQFLTPKISPFGLIYLTREARQGERLLKVPLAVVHASWIKKGGASPDSRLLPGHVGTIPPDSV